MNAKQWKEVKDVGLRGDPLKDVTDEQELFKHCLKLEGQLKKMRAIARRLTEKDIRRAQAREAPHFIGALRKYSS